MIADHLDAARGELRIKSKAQIDTETADTWGARAVAAWEVYVASGNLLWRDLAVEYSHECLEHAATGVNGTLERVCAELNAFGVP